MPLFSKVKGAKKPADENKQHSPEKAPPATESKPASYHHKPTHAATDALGSTPVSCQEADWERIRKEQRAHAQHQMSSTLVHSTLSTSSANTSTADSSVVTPASSTSKSSTYPQRIDFPPQPSTQRIYFSHKNPTAQPAKTDGALLRHPTFPNTFAHVFLIATPRMTLDPSPRHSEQNSIASETPCKHIHHLASSIAQ